MPQFPAQESPDLLSTAWHLLLAIGLGQILAWHYLRFAKVLTNKRRFARLFVFIAATTFLLITVVKTSLALSLGLVGALSIIRFRTPIKEPEELAYLFLAIAVGVGLGAQQALATMLVFAVLLLYLGIRRGSGSEVPLRTILQVTAPSANGDPSGAGALRTLLAAVEGPCQKVDLRRVDVEGDTLHASLLVELTSVDEVARVLQGVQDRLPGAALSVVERDSFE